MTSIFPSLAIGFLGLLRMILLVYSFSMSPRYCSNLLLALDVLLIYDRVIYGLYEWSHIHSRHSDVMSGNNNTPTDAIRNMYLLCGQYIHYDKLLQVKNTHQKCLLWNDIWKIDTIISFVREVGTHFLFILVPYIFYLLHFKLLFFSSFFFSSYPSFWLFMFISFYLSVL